LKENYLGTYVFVDVTTVQVLQCSFSSARIVEFDEAVVVTFVLHNSEQREEERKRFSQKKQRIELKDLAIHFPLQRVTRVKMCKTRTNNDRNSARVAIVYQTRVQPRRDPPRSGTNHGLSAAHG